MEWRDKIEKRKRREMRENVEERMERRENVEERQKGEER